MAGDRYVALLRGINVGGKNKVAMADLRSWVAGLGHTEVSTYINSGNVAFTARAGATDDVTPGQPNNALATEIERRIESEAGLRITVMVRSHAELTEAVAANPFPDADPSKLLFGFLGAELDAATVHGWNSIESGDDEMRVHGTVLYVHCPDGLGRSKLADQLLARRGPTMTTRNLRTVRKLIELSS
ncbi:DUF1697 domain-containing protein [Phytoactinopolyspora mesophila]|uniref:DUF1697 domain-containing protein n=1 Tax=Phytoactinopolyspora mesophila TaxID=2650750 RepID=A0A7K3MBV3_9ACTN|nr:DUF1697 domain-containing protein [Phytoactinopolyspora mesophila]NDL60805.1 DUF1697 domain-containing protein [Phytoactinopolyspora mesophila]